MSRSPAPVDGTPTAPGTHSGTADIDAALASPPAAALTAAPRPAFLTLVLITGFATLSLNMFLPSLANIASDLRVDYALVNLAIAGYAFSTGVMQLAIGPLSDRFGRRPVLLGSLAVFILASLGCAVSTDITMFLGFRLLQGVIIAGWVIAIAAVRDTSDAREAAGRIGYISMAMAVAPMLAPLAGGYIDAWFGWRASFVTFVVLGIVVFGLVWRTFPETNLSPSRTFAAQFAAYPELIRSRRFWGYALCLAFSTGAFYTFLGGVPLVARHAFAMPSETLGFWIGTSTLGYFFGSFAAGRVAERWPLAKTMIIGRGLATLAMLVGLALVSADAAPPVVYFATISAMGFGNGLAIPSASAGAVSVRPQLAGSASGLSGALTMLGGGIMSGITGVVVTPENAAGMLLTMILISCVLSLAAALFVRHVDRVDPLPSTAP
ncbi:MAG: multidrug effflux MFS transporter [Pseudomonadota bacterium]